MKITKKNLMKTALLKNNFKMIIEVAFKLPSKKVAKRKKKRPKFNPNKEKLITNFNVLKIDRKIASLNLIPTLIFSQLLPLNSTVKQVK